MAKSLNALVQYGASGSNVKELQKKLNQNGYKLTEDGIFGSKTQAAVEDYQKNNGLTVDGIVGEQTWGSLLGSSTSTNTANETTDNGFKYDDFTYDAYKESDIVKQAQAALNAQLAQKPGAYQSQWQTQLNDIMDKIMNREKFSYNFNEDALYQQYKDKFTQQAKLAMGDAIGQASAMTGGYGNSYAQSVGQQMYQKEMQNLNDIIPELYSMAYDKYNQEGQDLLNQYALVGDQEDRDYGRYRDSVADWLTERDYLANRYDSERDFDYSKYADDRNFDYNKYSDDKSYAYQTNRDAIADAQWQAEFEEAQRQFDEQMAQKAVSTGGSSSSGGSSGGSSGSSSGGSGYDNGGLTTSQIVELQKALGVTADGKYGPNTKQAANGLSASEAWEEYKRGTLGKQASDISPTQSKSTTDFINRYMTKSEYLARGHSEKEFNEYMESNLASFLRSGRLTDSEALYIIEYYGLS